MGRRFIAGLGLSVLLHAGAVGGTLGVALWRGLPGPSSVDVELTGIKVDDIKDLPLGPPVAGVPAESAGVVAQPAPRPKKRKPRPIASVDKKGSLEADEDKKKADEAARAGGERAAKPGDLKDWGPEGSRLNGLVRLDRLRATPYVDAVDGLMMLMPDRLGLLEGTGLDLYRDFDALLVATPNPRDYTATLLVLRHHLGDRRIRDAVGRNAAVKDFQVEWRTEGGRPVAERRSKNPAERSRDDRLIILPAPGLLVVAPPAYARILLAKKPPAAGSGAKASGGDDRTVDWTDLIERIAGQDSALPDDGVAMFSLFNVLGGTRGAADGEPPTPMLFGMPLPFAATITLGAVPAPFIDLRAEFAREADAARFESKWPDLHRQAITNPWVVLSGFGPIVDRIEVARDGRIIRARDTAGEQETKRILGIITNMLSRGRL